MRCSAKRIDACSLRPVVYKAPAFLRKDLITNTQLVLAKKRAYISLAGWKLYQTAFSVFVVIVLSPNSFLLLLFWDGPAANHSPSSLGKPDRALPSPAARFSCDRSTMVLVPVPFSGESFKPKDIQKKSAPALHPAWLLAYTLPFLCFCSILVALVPPSVKDSHWNQYSQDQQRQLCYKPFLCSEDSEFQAVLF